jgi:hypothetical protein
MPHKCFNHYFLQLTTESAESSINHASIYGSEQEPPIYFIADDSATDTATQLYNFKQSNEFTLLRQQYKFLLSTLDEWCMHNGIQKILNDELEDKSYPAFRLFEHRLFSGYYSIREIIFYNEGKKSLEDLVILINDEAIEPHIKKDTLSNLQQSIAVCSDGTLTNIVDAGIGLKESLSINTLIRGIKHELLQQFAKGFLQDVIKNYSIGDEIHCVNALYNHIANDYGLSKRDDHFINRKKITNKKLQQFKVTVENELTPELVLKELSRKIIDAFTNTHRRFKKHFFPDNTGFISYDNTVQAEADKFIQEWNNKYSALIELDLYAFIEPDDTDSMQIKLAPVNQTFIKAKLTRKFREIFLTTENQVIEIVNAEKAIKLTYDTGQLWFEQEAIYLNPENCGLFLEMKAMDCKAYWFLANQLLQFPAQVAIISKILCATAVDISTLISLWMENKYFNLISLVMHQLPITELSTCWLASRIHQPEIIALFNNLIDKGLITNKLLTIAPTSGPHAEKNALWWLGNVQQPDLLVALFRLHQKKLITSEQLATALLSGPNTGTNFIWLLKNWIRGSKNGNLFTLLIERNLIMSEHLIQVTTTGSHAAMNAIWILVDLINKYPSTSLLFFDLLKTGVILSKHLGWAPTSGPNAGKSILWQLATKIKTVKLFKLLVDKNLVTSEQLAMAPITGDSAGKNIIWYLAKWIEDPDIFALFKSLIEKDLITNKQLAMEASSLLGGAGNNAIKMLANKIHRPKITFLFKRLIEKNLINREQFTLLLSSERNPVWELVKAIKHAEFADLLRSLAVKDLIIKKQLVWAPASGPDAKINSIWILANHIQNFEAYTLFEQLLKKKLLTSKQLTMAPTTGFNANINAVCLLACFSLKPEVSYLFKLLLKQRLITSEQLSLTPTSSTLAKTNAIWWLAKYIKLSGMIISLWLKLLKQDLLTSEQLALAPSTGEYASKNAIWWLAEAINRPEVANLFRQLLEKGLITEKQLTAAPTTGPDSGISAIKLLADNTYSEDIANLFQIMLTKELISREQVPQRFMPTKPIRISASADAFFKVTEENNTGKKTLPQCNM